MYAKTSRNTSSDSFSTSPNISARSPKKQESAKNILQLRTNVSKSQLRHESMSEISALNDIKQQQKNILSQRDFVQQLSNINDTESSI